MTFDEIGIPGVYLVGADAFDDDRGTFLCAWLRKDFAAYGLDVGIAQASMAISRDRGCIRGMHYQTEPFEEAKAIRVVRGAIFDVVVDLRPQSPTYLKWAASELSTENRHLIYVPKGCAHGYQTLVDDTEVLYLVSSAYSPPHQRGVRWNDPVFGINWPLGPPSRINERDATYPDYVRIQS